MPSVPSEDVALRPEGPHPPLPLMTDTNGKSRQERTTENGEVKQAIRPDKVALYTTLTSRRGEQMVGTHHGVPPI